MAGHSVRRAVSVEAQHPVTPTCQCHAGCRTGCSQSDNDKIVGGHPILPGIILMKIFCQLFFPVSARYQHHTIFIAPMATVTTRKYQGELAADNFHRAGDTFLITLLLIDTVRMRDDPIL